MKERPVIFNGEMVRAILDGRKTQTRRVIKLSHERGMVNPVIRGRNGEISSISCRLAPTLCPFGQVGDRLWVRETFADVNTEGGPAFTYRADQGLKFCLDDESPVDYDRYPGKSFAMWCSDLWNGEDGHGWTPSIHMPRWASRITLEITDVRVERLNDISESDAKSEGVKPAGDMLPDYPDTFLTPNGDFATAKVAFQRLWQSIYGEESWGDNPWVWVIEFRRLEVHDASK
ncbi:hypothetical protein SMQC17_11020 [Serratia marcescens]|nr:hypothetical protein SMQC17_11020 [Serratia marcescens]